MSQLWPLVCLGNTDAGSPWPTPHFSTLQGVVQELPGYFHKQLTDLMLLEGVGRRIKAMQSVTSLEWWIWRANQQPTPNVAHHALRKSIACGASINPRRIQKRFTHRLTVLTTEWLFHPKISRATPDSGFCFRRLDADPVWAQRTTVRRRFQERSPLVGQSRAYG